MPRTRKATDRPTTPDPLEAAFAERALRDPRDGYRRMLRELKAKDAAAYRAAVTYHDEKLKPRLGGADADPIEEWVEYGRYIAELLAPGRTFTIDPTGRADPYRRPPPPDALVLHIPDPAGACGRVLCAPVEPSAPQQATCELLAR